MTIALVIAALFSVAALELVFVPIDPVLASPPDEALPVICQSVQLSQNSTAAACTFTANYYRGSGSLTYCFIGGGALYIKGEYHPFTQPGASQARQAGNSFCPAMHK